MTRTPLEVGLAHKIGHMRHHERELTKLAELAEADGRLDIADDCHDAAYKLHNVAFVLQRSVRALKREREKQPC